MAFNPYYAGECEICGHDLYKGDGLSQWSDDYVITDRGLICWDCWLDYGRQLMKEQEDERNYREPLF